MNDIKMTKVENSSAVLAFGYDHDSAVLAITLKSGKTYRYKDVPPDEVERFKGAESKGKYYATIRANYALVPA